MLSPGELNAYDVLVSDYVVFTRVTLPAFSSPVSVDPVLEADTDPSGEEEE